VLEKIADYLEAQTDAILRANAEDLAEARANGLSEALLDRLALNPARLSGLLTMFVRSAAWRTRSVR
jgi:glutamate-5-semialdehyde dehydrogenase